MEDRIDHDQLGESLGISRLPVREALVILERDGIVSMKYHRGVFVEPFDAESILDDFEIMGLLSGVAVRRLAARPAPETVAVLQGLLNDLRAHTAAGVGEGDQHVLAGRRISAFLDDVVLIEIGVRCLDGEAAALGHCVARVDGEIEQRRFELVGIECDAP